MHEENIHNIIFDGNIVIKILTSVRNCYKLFFNNKIIKKMIKSEHSN